MATKHNWQVYYLIGPLSGKLFTKMQILLQYCNEAQRYEALYNLLKMMKEETEQK